VRARARLRERAARDEIAGARRAFSAYLRGMQRILVTQATGRIGREVVPRLMERGCVVTAGTVEPQRAALLFGDAVAVEELDYLRPETYDAAALHASRVLLVPSPLDPQADEELEPFLERAAEAGVEHVVLLSAMGLEWRRHVAVRRVERKLLEIGMPCTFIRPNWYMQNFLAGYLSVPIRQSKTFALPLDNSPVSFVDASDVADVIVDVLCGEVTDGETLDAHGARGADAGPRGPRVLSQATGSEISYRTVSDDEMRSASAYYGWPQDRAEVAIGLFRSMRNGERAA
jgi:uncharacterized protein YbjT (DUF2867 family)